MKHFSCETRHFSRDRVLAGRQGGIGPASYPYDDHVREIGVRELKAKLGSVLRRVEGGERVRVTRRGRPVADIVPVETAEEQRQRMIAEGRITPGVRPLPKNPPPPIKTSRPASELILAEREEDR